MCCCRIQATTGGGLNNLSKPTIDVEDTEESPST